MCGRRRNVERRCGRREPWLALQCLLQTRALKSPLFSQPWQQLCHLCRLQAEGSGKTVCSHFVRASVPAGSKARKGPCPSPSEVWRSLPASSTSLGGERSLSEAGGSEAAGEQSMLEGVGAPSRGTRPLLLGFKEIKLILL